MIPTVITALAALVIALALVAKSNHKRINQLERDLTYLMAGSAEAEVHHDGSVVLNPPKQDEQPTIHNTADAAHTLREAGVQDRKAYRAAQIAIAHGWNLLDIQENIKMVRYMRANGGDVQKVNIYHGGKGGKRELYTVATALNHPTKGKTQLFRKYINEHELAEVLKNPRVHTEKGYYTGAGKGKA